MPRVGGDPRRTSSQQSSQSQGQEGRRDRCAQPPAPHSHGLQNPRGSAQHLEFGGTETQGEEGSWGRQLCKGQHKLPSGPQSPQGEDCSLPRSGPHGVKDKNTEKGSASEHVRGLVWKQLWERESPTATLPACHPPPSVNPQTGWPGPMPVSFPTLGWAPAVLGISRALFLRV